MAAVAASALLAVAARAESVGVSLEYVPAGGPHEARVRLALQPALREALRQGTPQTLADVDDWSARLTAGLRQGGFPLGLVLMTQGDWQANDPTHPQRGGIVFTVFPGRLSAIEVRNSSRMDAAALQRLITQAMCGQPLVAADSGGDTVCLFQTRHFERATQLLQDLPGVALGGAPEVAPGAAVGDVKAVFVIVPKGDPYAVNAAVDNNGVQATGRARATLSLSGNNHFGRGEDYAATLTRTDKGMWTGSLSGGIPIAADGLRASGGFTRQRYTVSAGGTTFLGSANTVNAGLVHPFTRGLDGNLWGGLSVLYSKTTVDYRDFGFATHSTIDSLKLAVSANNGDRARQLRTDQWGGQIALTAGRQRNDDALDAGPRRAGAYLKLAASGYGSWALDRGGDWFVTARGSGQYASRNLDPSEQLPLGGPGAVRAYRGDEPTLNEGVVVNLGLYKRFPVAVGHQIQLGPILDVAVGRVNHASWDGWAQSHPPGVDAQNTRRLGGWGLEAAWLTPFGATVTVSAAQAFGFSDRSWIEPDKDPVQYWLTVSWAR